MDRLLLEAQTTQNMLPDRSALLEEEDEGLLRLKSAKGAVDDGGAVMGIEEEDA